MLQPGPQSWANEPTPSTPLAPRLSTLLSAVPLLQLVGADGRLLLSSRILIGTLLAFSPPMITSAIATGPQVKPSANGRHSSIALPDGSVCMGSASLPTTDAMRRKPTEPVSTSTLAMGVQVLVLGIQTVTLVVGMFWNALVPGPTV